MDSTAGRFENNARAALAKLADGFPSRRLESADRLPEFEALRDAARDIKDHVLDHPDATQPDTTV